VAVPIALIFTERRWLHVAGMLAITGYYLLFRLFSVLG
jgi:hypothetical protein